MEYKDVKDPFEIVPKPGLLVKEGYIEDVSAVSMVEETKVDNSEV